jgi:hypothetical protein
MRPLTAGQIMELADAFASDMLQFADTNGVLPRDLIMASSISHRLLQMVLPPTDVLNVEQEADATLVASSQRLEGN